MGQCEYCHGEIRSLFLITEQVYNRFNSKGANKKYEESDDRIVNFTTLILRATVTEFLCQRLKFIPIFIFSLLVFDQLFLLIRYLQPTLNQGTIQGQVALAGCNVSPIPPSGLEVPRLLTFTIRKTIHRNMKNFVCYLQVTSTLGKLKKKLLTTKM